MATSICDGDLSVRGRLSAQVLAIPAGAITDAQIAPGADIGADKLVHRIRAVFNQVNGSIAVTERRPVFWAFSTGLIRRIKVGSVVINIGAATITVDVKKNGTSILSVIVTLNNANIAYIPVDATMASATLAAGDVLEVVVTATAGGGTLGQGLFVFIDVDEEPV